MRCAKDLLNLGGPAGSESPRGLSLVYKKLHMACTDVQIIFYRYSAGANRVQHGVVLFRVNRRIRTCYLRISRDPV